MGNLAIALGGMAVELGGDGKTILLLRGYLQTHVCRYSVALLLAEHFTIVYPDLRESAEHLAYLKKLLFQ